LFIVNLEKQLAGEFALGLLHLVGMPPLLDDPEQPNFAPNK